MQDDFVKRRTCGLLAATATAALFLGAQPATAQVSEPISGPTAIGDVCLQQIFGGSDTVTNANRVNCTANDVRISGVATDEEGDPKVFPERCTKGETFDLTATFEVEVTAANRYDLAFIFGVGGQDDARDPTETCSLSALDPSLTPGEDLDELDTCGDLNAGTYEATFTIEGVECVGVPDPENPDSGELVLQLPNCTSWHSNQGTVCQLTDTDPREIDDPADFAPDTKSKCVCDDDFTVPVAVEAASITVAKVATPTTVSEPGGAVEFEVSVTNDLEFVSVTIDSVLDDIYGNIDLSGPTTVTETDCDGLLGVVLAPQESTFCTFTGDVIGNVGEPQTDTAEVCVIQNPEDPAICVSDIATVDIINVPSAPLAEKQGTLLGCTVEVDYTVTVTNPSTFDSLTVTSLMDSVFGNIQDDSDNPPITSTDCDELTTIPAEGNDFCTFTVETFDADCTFTDLDKVTATGTDEEGTEFSVDTNTVTVSASGVTVTDNP